MRKVLSVLFAVIMCFSAVTAVFATELITPSQEVKAQVKYNEEFEFAYTEVIGSDHTIYRSYQSESVLTGDVTQLDAVGSRKTDDTPQSPEKTKAILRSLGMGQEFIDMLSEEDLAEYAGCKSIMGITVYTKTDAEGNVVNISEEEATSNAVTRNLPEQDLIDPTPGPSGSYSNTYEDAYMSMYYQVLYFGDGYYRFSVDATWLTSPFWRFTDSLGACAQNIAIHNSTREGWYRCTVKIYDAYGIDEYPYMYNFDDFYTVQSGNWDGSAATFNLYNDYYSLDGTTSIIARNQMAHYQFYGYVNYPGQETYFNTSATYSHSIVLPIIEPSITISETGVGVSIGLSAVVEAEDRIVEFPNPIHYLGD